jgi:hypothetical protein
MCVCTHILTMNACAALLCQSVSDIGLLPAAAQQHGCDKHGARCPSVTCRLTRYKCLHPTCSLLMTCPNT